MFPVSVQIYRVYAKYMMMRDEPLTQKEKICPVCGGDLQLMSTMFEDAPDKFVCLSPGCYYYEDREVEA